jgi:plastocyanin
MNGRIARRLWTAVAISCTCPLSLPAALHEVTVENFRFSPNDLTIQAGDTVRWTNVEGFHDATADDFSWTSGSGFDWVYERAFDAAGEVLYHCTVHSGPGQSRQTSMNGRITVEAPAESPLFADGFE